MKALIEVDETKPVVGYKTVADYNNQVNGQKGTIIFQNAEPGRRGNFQPNSLVAPGRWTLDANMSKSVEFMEGKRIEIRVDAQNLFNSATPTGPGAGMFDSGGSSIGARGNAVSTPQVNVNTTGTTHFGYFNNKTGHRTFQGRIRITF